MRTSGIIYTRVKNVILSIFALLATAPVLAQLNYTFQKNTSFPGKDYELVSGSRNYYAIPDNSIPAAFFASFAERNIYAGEKITYSNKQDTRKSLLHREYNNEPNTENAAISFKPTSFTYPKNSKADIGITQYSTEQLILYAKLLKQYSKKNSFDTAYAFLSNMGMLSNKKRFFVINLVTLEIEQAGLVSHGRGQGQSVYDKQYSNQAGSNSTSLGRYKISGKYNGDYGEAYKMIGLDSSNKNAYNRNIVLHSMSCIPDAEGITPACASEGCPSVSTKFFSFLRQIIDSRKKPVLLWIFDSNLEELVVEDGREKNSLAITSQKNNGKWNIAFQLNPELTFHKNDYAYIRRVKYTKFALTPDISSPEQNNYTNKSFFTMKPCYTPKSLNPTVFHTENVLPQPTQSWARELVNTKPVFNRALFIPVDIGYVFIKGKKNQSITLW